MNQNLRQMYASSPLFGGNAAYVEDLYASWLQDPASVPARWRQFFAEQAPPGPQLPTPASPVGAGSQRTTATPAARRKAGGTEEILTCLECGMKMKMLKRHLLTVHGMTPEDYRRKHNLPGDAPMVTSNYAELRSKLAKASGLGKRQSGRGRG